MSNTKTPPTSGVHQAIHLLEPFDDSSTDYLMAWCEHVPNADPIVCTSIKGKPHIIANTLMAVAKTDKELRAVLNIIVLESVKKAIEKRPDLDNGSWFSLFN